jgi:hypothetical protein
MKLVVSRKRKRARAVITAMQRSGLSLEERAHLERKDALRRSQRRLRWAFAHYAVSFICYGASWVLGSVKDDVTLKAIGLVCLLWWLAAFVVLIRCRPPDDST